MRFFRSAAAQPLTPSAEIQMSEHADELPDLRIAAALLVREDGCTLLVRKRGTTSFMQPGGKIVYSREGPIDPAALKKAIVDDPAIGRYY